MKIIKNSKLIGSAEYYPIGKHVNTWIKIVDEYANIIKSLVKKNDEIGLVCTGSSGTIISALLFTKLVNYDVVIYHLKKEGENAHSAKRPYLDEDRKLFIIDDFICTGATLDRIVEIYKLNTFEAIIVCQADKYPDYGNVKALYCQ